MLHFGLRYVNYSGLYGHFMFTSEGGGTENINNRLRPVVSLGADIQITPCEGDNDESNMHQISKR